MAGLGGERLPHGVLGVFDGALAITRKPVIDPGVGPARILPNRNGEGLLGARRLAHRRPGLAIGVMRRRELRRPPAGFARCDERSVILADGEMRDSGVEKRGGIVSEGRLRLFEAL